MVNRIFKSTFIYVIGDILNKSIPFFMLPILTRYLTPEDYGKVSVFNVLISIFAVFTGLSIHGAINVNFFKMSKKDLKIFIGNCLIILSISTLIVFICVYLFKSIILEKLSIEIKWIFLAIVLAFAQFLTTVNLLLWMAEQKPKQYTIYQISQTFLITILSIILIVYLGMNWEGQVIARGIGIIFFAVISFIFIIKRGYLIFHPNKKYIKEALNFGIPLIPHQLAGWLKTGVDRIILISLLGAAATGVYATGYQMGMIISVIVTAFNKAWSPYIFKILSSSPSSEDKKKIVMFSYAYFVGIFLVSVVFAYILNLIVPYILGKNFLHSIEYVFYFCIAFAFQGMYLIVGGYILYTKKTHILAYITFATSILHVILLYTFVNINGAVGAAQATLISFIVTFLATWILASKVYKMPWRIWET